MKILTVNINRRRSGFTLAETLVAMGIGSAVIAGMMTLFVIFNRSYNTTTLIRNSSMRADLALERMVYGIGTNNAGLRAARSSTVVVTTNGGWKIAYTNLWFQYTSSTKKITDQSGKVICSNVVASTLTTTSTTNGCDFSVTVVDSAGGRSITNTMSTFVQFRN